MNTNTNTNNTANTITAQDVERAARQATLATLKRIYAASGEKRILDLYFGLVGDFNTFDNGKPDTISDGYDLFAVAYSFLWEQYANGASFDDPITITLKSGKVKTLTVFQGACRAVRSEVYKHSDANKSNFLYINDFSATDDVGNTETFGETCDRLIRVNKYYDLPTYEDYTTTTEMLTALNLTGRDRDIINKRLQGISVSKIAEKYGVSQQAISKALARIQATATEKFPEKVRRFKLKRAHK